MSAPVPLFPRCRAGVAALLMPVLAGCGGGGGSSDSMEVAGLTPPPVTSPLQVNLAPGISGNVATSLVQDTPYRFVPVASDPEGDPITFAISNLPSWAVFDTATGALSGTPTGADLGIHADISITVSDGQASATLGPFSIEVLPVAPGSLTLSWTPPTQSADGSQLDDLAGYRIRWGTQSGNYLNMAEVNNPGISSFVVDNLAPGTHFFAVSAFDTSNNESNLSNEAIGIVP